MVTEKLLSHITYYQLGAVVLMTALAAAFWSAAALAIGVGGLLMAGNFWLVYTFAGKALKGARPKVAYALLYGVKLLAVMGAMALALLVFHLDALGFAVGMSSLFVGIGLATAHQALAPAQATAASR